MRTHCSINVANKADVVLSKKLSSHNMFTHIMEVLGGDEGYDCGWT